MTTHPFLPLYVDDYDAATAHLTPEEDGIYCRLLRLCWRTPGCSLPNDHAWIARKIRLSLADFERVGLPVLNEFFKLQRGRLVQKRLKAEYDSISRKKSARKLAGKMGGEAKARKIKDNTSSNASDLPAHTRAFPEPEPEPEPEDKEAIASSVAPAPPAATAQVLALDPPKATPDGEPWDRDEHFAKLWAAAPPDMRKRGKSKANVWPEWRRARKHGDPEAIVRGLIRYKALDADVARTGGPGLHIWLKARTWEQWTGPEAPERIGDDWPDTRWDAALTLWRNDGSWDDRLGPEPGKPGCRVPAHLLRPREVQLRAVGGAG